MHVAMFCIYIDIYVCIYLRSYIFYFCLSFPNNFKDPSV